MSMILTSIFKRVFSYNNVAITLSFYGTFLAAWNEEIFVMPGLKNNLENTVAFNTPQDVRDTEDLPGRFRNFDFLNLTLEKILPGV